MRDNGTLELKNVRTTKVEEIIHKGANTFAAKCKEKKANNCGRHLLIAILIPASLGKAIYKVLKLQF